MQGALYRGLIYRRLLRTRHSSTLRLRRCVQGSRLLWIMRWIMRMAVLLTPYPSIFFLTRMEGAAWD
ncbi:hypothetical protein BJX99DRAFT_238729 [Aspergillus californicus]